MNVNTNGNTGNNNNASNANAVAVDFLSYSNLGWRKYLRSEKGEYILPMDNIGKLNVLYGHRLSERHSCKMRDTLIWRDYSCPSLHYKIAHLMNMDLMTKARPTCRESKKEESEHE